MNASPHLIYETLRFHVSAIRIVFLLLWAVSAPAQSQFTYVTNNGTITITRWNGAGDVTIPGMINGLPVTSIGPYAFFQSRLTSVTIPASVTNIGDYAFALCTSLSNVAIPSSVASIGYGAFGGCTRLTSVTIPNSLASIGDEAFESCGAGLTGLYFEGNAPSLGGAWVFLGDNNATVYYLPGTTGWGPTFGGRPTGLWNQEVPCAYTTNGGTITITRYIGVGGAVTIPDTINGLPVISIGDSAFSGCTTLTSITIGNYVTSIGGFGNCTSLTNVMIPNSVTNIGGYAFAGCTSPSNVAIPSSVASIGYQAFDGCTGLTSVMIPNNVIHIGEWAFYNCPSLTAITVDAMNPAYSSVGGVLFNKTQTVVIQCPQGRAGSFIIPNSVTSIGAGAFEGCTSLTNVMIPNSVTNIGGYAFAGCTSLTVITVDPMNPAYSSADGVLFDKRQTTLIRSPGGKAGSYTVPNSVTNIWDSAFYGCTHLTSVTIPDSVISIGYEAFVFCTGLTELYFKGNAPSLGGAWVFLYDNNATVYYLPGTTGWGLTFGGCPTMRWDLHTQFNFTTNNSTITITRYIGSGGAVTIPDTINGWPVTSIGDSAFSGCGTLTSITIGNYVTSIGTNAFYACTNLTSVAIPDSVTSVGYGAFQSCTSLTNVTIGNGATTIAEYAFASCTSLTNVTIGSGTSTLRDYAFADCTSLTSIHFKGNAPSIGSLAFNKDNNAIVYYLLGTCGWGPTLGGLPTALWVLPNSLILTGGPSFGVLTNRFGFIISWATNVTVVVVEACTNLATPAWLPLQTNVLTGGWSYFGDPNWTNYPTRFYRVRWP